MNHALRLACLLAMLHLAPGGAHAANVSEPRAIDAQVQRVRLDGIVDLKLRQGAVATLRLVGDQGVLERVTIVQQGDTLLLGSAGHLRRAAARAELVLPQLREVVSEGAGTAEISGFTGEELEITLEGAGSMKVVCDYRRLTASLGGLGSMHLWVANNDRLDIDLQGAGYVTLGGRSRFLKASLGGLGGLNAQQFQADVVDVELSGLGNATVHARDSASLSLSGLGSVTVYGNPTRRIISVDGLGKVSWK